MSFYLAIVLSWQELILCCHAYL